jgi:ADP-heptose:LPS heptosyltransferase
VPNRSSARALVPERGRIAIFRALPGLGDLVCATPALRALRLARPDVEITLIGLERTRPLVERYRHLIDDFLPFPGFPGLPEQRLDPAALPPFLIAAQRRRFDLAIQLHGSGSIANLVVGLLGARRTAGHVPPGAARPDPETFLPWIEDASEVRRSLRLMALLGWPSSDERLDFRIAPDTAIPPVPAPYVVVHPGASVPSRRWAAGGFVDVANALAADGYHVVLTGSVDEQGHNAQVAHGITTAVTNLTGRTSLDELGAVVRGARLLLANDTGVAHLADALGVPSVVVFTGSNASRWSPLDATRHRAVPGSARRVLREARRLLGALPETAPAPLDGVAHAA